jgi:hypothetical protein
MLDRLVQAARRVFGSPALDLPVVTERSAAPLPALTSVTPRVLLIVHNPPVASEGGRRLNQIFGWNDPDALAAQYARDMAECSGGYLRYQIVDRIQADFFPLKLDGFRYTGESYVQGWRSRQMHEPDRIDYESQIREFKLIERFENNEFDEVWFMTFPYAGDWESTMVGRDAFWCNSPPVPNTGHCRGRFIMMGFNYERGVDCMLENFGHRTESIMSHVFRHHPPEQNMWERFIRYDKTHPGGSHCGNVHFAPCSERDYDWGNPRRVLSYCDDWYSYPDLPGQARVVGREEWGGGEMRLHHLWWQSHLPRAAGSLYGVSNNWWEYLALARNPDLPWAPLSPGLGRHV